MVRNKILKTVVVGMSGGVDSSVCALLLKQQGYKVVGLHMLNENLEARSEDEKRVRELCFQLGIDCVVVEYKDQMQVVKDYFINEYKAGRTPNPCVICNKEVKFNPFIEYAKQIKADYFATGHYAKIEHTKDGHILLTAKDSDKDQTYFLCQLSQKQLEKALFPLGDLTKTEVRKLAEENNLISAETKDSYDVCFLGSQKFKDFMNQYYPEKAGDIVDKRTGNIVGKHNGISKYTLGQRRGIGVGGLKGSNGDSWFVVGKDIKNNILYVTQGEGKELLSTGLISKNINWIPNKPSNNEFICKAKFRYRQESQDVMVKINTDNSVMVTFTKPQRAVTIGQYVVFYNENMCLGGGVIDEVINSGC